MAELFNKRHELFARHIASGMDVDAAYVASGYAQDRGNSARLRAQPHIEKRINEIMGRALRKVDVTAERIVSELAKMAFYDPADFITVDDSGNATFDLSRLDKDAAAAITEIIPVTGPDGRTSTRVKMADRHQALTTLGRHHGLWTDRVEQGKPGDFSQAASADDIADRMLREAGVAEPSEDAKAQVKMALSHLTECIKAIAQGEATQPDSNPYRVGGQDNI